MKYKACESCARSVGLVNVAGNIMMIVIKAYLGVVGGSMGLIADAVHSVADLLATFVMMFGLKLSAKEPNERYPDGFGKSEYMIAICIYIFLFCIGLFIMHDGYITIVEKRPVHPCWFALWGAFFAIAINELMFRQSVCAGNQLNSPSMIAKAWESRSDVYASIAVLIGIIGAMMGYSFMDPLAAFIVGVIILKLCIESIYESVLKLIDQVPEGEFAEEIGKAVDGVESVVSVGKVLARELGPVLELKVWLNVPGGLSVAQGEAVKANAEAAIRKTITRTARITIKLSPA